MVGTKDEFATAAKARGLQIPEPMDLSNAQVLKEPVLWPVLFTSLSLKREAFVTAEGGPGTIIPQLMDSLKGIYSSIKSTANDWVVSKLYHVVELMKCVGLLVLTLALKDYNVVASFFYKQASDLISQLDRDYVTKNCGRKAGQVFASHSTLDKRLFGERAQASLSKVASAANREGSDSDGEADPKKRRKKSK